MNIKMEAIGLQQKDTLSTTDNKNSTFETEIIENTPFTMVEIDNKYFAVIGEYKVTEEYNTKQELLNKINEKDWGLITSLIGVLIEKSETIKQLITQAK